MCGVNSVPILGLARPFAHYRIQSESSSLRIFHRSLSRHFMARISLARWNLVTSLPRGVDMIHKLDNVLPENVRHLQRRKVSSLNEVIVSHLS